jgi:hypothetical protein
VAEHGPSEKAVQAALDSLKGSSSLSIGIGNKDDAACGLAAFDALTAAHDPELGLDRSVCLRDVVGALRAVRHDGEHDWDCEEYAQHIEESFTESSSPDREGAE